MNSFDVFLDKNLRLVKVTAFGELFQKDGEEIITAARKAAVEEGYNIFYDLRQATTTVTFASWFNLPRNLDVFKHSEAWHTRAAILASRNDKAVNDYEFYELVAGNIGLKLRVFFEEVEAIKWLTEKSAAEK